MNIETIKGLIGNNTDYHIETHNRITGWVGYASFYTNGEEKIYVNEGDPSGSDDAEYSYDEFMDKYDFLLVMEEL